jgi:hypothetical protein
MSALMLAIGVRADFVVLNVSLVPHIRDTTFFRSSVEFLPPNICGTECPLDGFSVYSNHLSKALIHE